ncbi:MAG TPA: D-alanyl-D-alanine carboxypeptidase family protein [Pseudonocardiaceae bacterium]|nr:D-alanyl-D-alanine carboxypeptidase family protein [Pseudonocardiaceae bacterium]
MIGSRAVVALVVALGASILLGAVPGTVQSAATTSAAVGCPQQITPPPPVDLSEVPAPGSPAPLPMSVPNRPMGGPLMGVCGLVLPVNAPLPPAGISATSWLVADANSGEVLAARSPHARHRPASTIKLLTALLAAERLPLNRVVVATQADVDQEGSKAGLGPGGRYTVRQLLTGLLLVSGNDTAHALAVQLGGVAETVEQMNELAAGLGALDTRAATPSGLDGPGMSTSAYDLALVFREVLNRPLLTELLSTRQVRFPGFGERPGFVLSNDNKLLRNYPGALGGKTGFTDDARHTQVDAAQRGGRRLIVILMRGEQRPVPMWEQAARLLNYGFALAPGRPVGRLVDEAAPLETAGPAPGSTGATSGLRELPAADAQDRPGRPPGAGGLIPVALWIGAAVIVLAVLGALVARQRH